MKNKKEAKKYKVAKSIFIFHRNFGLLKPNSEYAAAYKIKTVLREDKKSSPKQTYS